MRVKVQDQNQEEEIREAFKVFDHVSKELYYHEDYQKNTIKSGWEWIH